MYLIIVAFTASAIVWLTLCRSAKEADAAAERLWKEKENDD